MRKVYKIATCHIVVSWLRVEACGKKAIENGDNLGGENCHIIVAFIRINNGYNCEERSHVQHCEREVQSAHVIALVHTAYARRHEAF